LDSLEREKHIREMLTAIFEETGGQPSQSVNMWKVGEKLGITRNDIEGLAMELVAEGILEIRSLSGGLSLTDSGLAQVAGFLTPDHEQKKQWTGISGLVEQIRSAASRLNMDDQVRQDLQIDLETLAMHDRRSRPLAGVVSSVLDEIRRILEENRAPDDVMCLLENYKS
jgi:hypothetical protein